MEFRNIFVMTLGGLLLAQGGASGASPGSGIAGTAHDFTSASSVRVGLCTFCHTPHKAISTKLLWNHTLSSGTFSWSTATTTAGTTYPKFSGQSYQGPSAKCLSCHDGTVAVGNLAWFRGKKPPVLDTRTVPGLGAMGATTSGDLSGNHPIAMPYPYQQQRNTYNGVTTGPGYYADQWLPAPTAPVRLYNDNGSGNISAGPVPGKSGIECSSCHDPHNKLAVDDFFLLGKEGDICYACHVK